MKEFKTWFEENTGKIVILARGLPGSGKSFTVNRLVKEFGVSDKNIFSADHYFIPMTREFRQQGIDISPKEERDEYLSNFNHVHLPLAHETCFNRFKNAVDKGVSPLVVDNTNVSLRQIENYVVYASAAGYDVRLQEPESPWWKEYSPYLANKQKHADKVEELIDILHQKNSHDVPKETLRHMVNMWEPNLTVDKVFEK